VGDHWTHIGTKFLKIGIMIGYISRHGTHNETKLPKKRKFDGSYGTHKGTEFPKKENLMKFSSLWGSKVAFLGNFFF